MKFVDIIKRLFDIVFSFIGLLLLLPLFLLVAILIKIDSRGPIFFKQQRIGRNFAPFAINKFRTMKIDADGNGLQITVGGDKRITRIGKILRKSKIDELPQLLNVLIGDMSIVGSRPEMPQYVEFYKTDYKDILSKRPGITDIASVTFRDEESVLKDKDDPEWYYKFVLLPRKIELAQKYTKQATFFSDLKIILMTFYRLFRSNTQDSFLLDPQNRSKDYSKQRK